MPDQRSIDGDVRGLICAEHFMRQGGAQRGRRLALSILSPPAWRRACTVVSDNSGETLRVDAPRIITVTQCRARVERPMIQNQHAAVRGILNSQYQ